MTTGAAEVEAPSRAVRRAVCARAFVVGAMFSTAATGAAAACGGTTGREGLPVSAGQDGSSAPGVDATVSDGPGSADASGLDAGTFDVLILYADQSLPDVGAASDAGTTEAGEGGPPWDCPTFIGVRRNGMPVVPGSPPARELPSVYDDAGNIVPAPDGSACATYGWLGSAAIDECGMGFSAAPFSELPPCNWCAEAGAAVQGKYAGEQRYFICQQLYDCMVRTHCAENPALSVYCLCGSETPTACANDPNPPGPCAEWELGSLEVSAQVSGALTQAILNYTDFNPGDVYFCAGTLNDLWENAAQEGCFPADEGGSGD
jgi:hypothetical protein